MSKPTASTSFSFYKNETGTFEHSETFGFANINTFSLNQVYTKTYTATRDCTLRYILWGNANADIFEFQFWAELAETTDYEVHKEESVTIPVQQEMLSGDYFDEKTKEEAHIWGKNVLNGTENWQISSDTKMFYITNVINSIDYSKVYCSHAISAYTYAELLDGKDRIAIRNSRKWNIYFKY